MDFPFISAIKFPDWYLYFELKINKHITGDRKNQIYGHKKVVNYLSIYIGPQNCLVKTDPQSNFL